MSKVKMVAPKDFGGMTFGGMPIEADKRGIATIPAQFIDQAKSFGFTEYEASPQEILSQAKSEHAAAVSMLEDAIKAARLAKDTANKAKHADKDAAVAASADADAYLEEMELAEAAAKNVLVAAQEAAK